MTGGLNIDASAGGASAPLTLKGGSTAGVQVSSGPLSTGKLYGSSSPPALSACGTGSPSLSTGANDVHGKITEGTTATGCVLTFVQAFTNNPDCVVTAPDGIAATSYSTASGGAGSAKLTIVNASATGDTFTYVCMGK